MSLFRGLSALKLNDDSFSDLRRAGLPQHSIEALAPLNGVSFASGDALLTRAAELAGDEVATRHRADLTRSARVLRPRRVVRLLGHIWRTYVAPTRLQQKPFAYMAVLPLVLALRLRARYWFFVLTAGLTGRRSIAQRSNSNVEGFAHNRKQVLSWLEGHRNRTESIMNILRTIQELDCDSAKVLAVGPRNEAEILLLRAYGFRPDNITAVDLFSYSPIIQLMDMNELQLPDDCYDVYYSSAVIKYSPDIKKSVAEAVRVTRNGGIMAFGFMFGMQSDIIPTGSELAGGTSELLEHFGDIVEHVYWREEYRVAADDVRASVIFRIRK